MAASRSVAGPRPWQPWRVLVRDLVDDAKTALARAWLQLDVRRLPGLPDDPRDRRHDRRAWPSRIARCSSGRRPRPSARQHGPAARTGTRLFVEADAGQPAVRGRRAARRGAAAAACAAGGRCRSCCCGWRRRCSPTGSASPSRGAGRRSGRPIAGSFDWRPAGRGATSTRSSTRRITGCRRTTVQEAPEPVVAHRTSPTNIGMGLLATLAAHDLGFIRDRRARRPDRRDADHDRGPGALRRPPVQLVRLADAGAARAAVRLVGGQRQSRGGAAHAGERAAARRSPNPDPVTLSSDLDDLAILLQQAIERADGEHSGDWPEAGASANPCARCAASWPARASVPQKRENAAGRAGGARGRRAELEAGPAGAARIGNRLLGRAVCVTPSTRAGQADSTAPERLEHLARRATALADAHELPRCSTTSRAACCRSAIVPPTPRVPAASTPRTTTCSPRKRGSPASSRSPRATSPRRTGSGSAGPSRASGACPTLLSWGATMFEYLMPLLVMRSYPETLLDETCRMAVQRQIQYGEERDVPWGISECAYNVVDRHGTYQYRAFGVPGLGLRRGLGDDLVVAPYATALAAMIEPAAAVENLRRLGAEGRRRAVRLLRRRGLHVARRRFRRRHAGRARKRRRLAGTVVRTTMAHHQGMTLVSIANVLLGHPMVERFHADPAHQGDRTAAAGARAAARAGDPAASARGHPRGGPDRAPTRSAASARRRPGFRTRRSCRTATTSPSSPTPAAARASAAAAR